MTFFYQFYAKWLWSWLKINDSKNKPNSIDFTEGQIKSTGDLGINANWISMQQLAVVGHISSQNGIIRTENGNIDCDRCDIVAKEGNIYTNNGYLQAKDVLINSFQQLKKIFLIWQKMKHILYYMA